jgi:4'-phosphopantetheinyl transferase
MLREHARARVVDVWALAASRLSPDLQTLAGRALVRAVLSARFGASPDAWRLSSTPAGRPYVVAGVAGADFDFNLTHAGGLVCCALVEGPGRVGVDVERCDRAFDADALAAVALTADERAGLDACEPSGQRLRILRLLTLKEAFLKALGCGLSVRPTRVAFDLDPDGRTARLRGPAAARWSFATRVRGGFVLAVAAETGAGHLALRLHPGSALCRATAPSLPSFHARSAA